jgi:DNA-binding MarR family transcriptional regulator
VVRLTEHGRAAYDVIRQAALQVEAAWAEALGQETYGQLRHALARLETILDEASNLR